jgi:hypothetical protein
VNLAGYNGAQHPILQALLIFQTNTVAMSFVLAWLVQRSGSIWPAALAHAANNVLQSGTPIVANDWRVDQIAGTLASIVIGAICAWLLIRRESQESAGPERIADVPSKELLRRAYEAAKDVTLKSAPGQQTEVQ